MFIDPALPSFPASVNLISYIQHLTLSWISGLIMLSPILESRVFNNVVYTCIAIIHDPLGDLVKSINLIDTTAEPLITSIDYWFDLPISISVY